MRYRGLMIGLILVFATGPVASGAPSPGPGADLPGLDFEKKDRDREECLRLASAFKAEKDTAQSALNNCNLQLFHASCLSARKISVEGRRKGGPCTYVMDKKGLKFPELNCEIIPIPSHCGN